MNGPEGHARDLLVEKGMDPIDAGILGFDLVNATGFVELAEDGLRAAIERRNEQIRAAVEAGLSYRTVAQLVDLSFPRVAQIIAAS